MINLKENIRYVRRLKAVKHLTKKQLYQLSDYISNKNKYDKEDNIGV